MAWQVLLHEGGTLLVCLNSIRALKEPAWSWKRELREALHRVRRSLAAALRSPPAATASAGGGM